MVSKYLTRSSAGGQGGGGGEQQVQVGWQYGRGNQPQRQLRDQVVSSEPVVGIQVQVGNQSGRAGSQVIAMSAPAQHTGSPLTCSCS